MLDTPTTPLPASWLATRLGADVDELDRLRVQGELYAVRSTSADEWAYSAWQFGPRGSIPRGVREAVRAAQSAGLSEEHLLTILKRRAGLMGGARLYDLLFEGRSDFVIEAVRSAQARDRGLDSRSRTPRQAAFRGV